MALIGDLRHGRAARSLAMLLAETRGVELIAVTPPGLEFRPDVLDDLATRGVPVLHERDLKVVLPAVDVVYQTRVQRERFAGSLDAGRAGGVIFDEAALALLAPGAILLHPLPRVDEIAAAVDADPRAAYFRQAHNGLFVRMALLLACLEGRQPAKIEQR